MITLPTNYYTFKGNWFELFEKVVNSNKPQILQKFSIWESRSAETGNLLIIYGATPGGFWQELYEVDTIDKAQYESQFKTRRSFFKIHGYNEFRVKKQKRLSVSN